MAVPNPITIMPIPKQTNLLNTHSGIIKFCHKNNHISIPMPVIIDVTNPKTSGLCLVNKELQTINSKAMMISQLPTVRPTFVDSPTKSASKGDVPRPDWIVNETPKVNSKIPTT